MQDSMVRAGIIDFISASQVQEIANNGKWSRTRRVREITGVDFSPEENSSQDESYKAKQYERRDGKESCQENHWKGY